MVQNIYLCAKVQNKIHNTLSGMDIIGFIEEKALSYKG